jgi:tripartite-type tricarboxylate transporter receptor subunit TctC
MMIENRSGAGGFIGTEDRAAPDGNTLLTTLLIITPDFVISPHLRKLNYDPLTRFVPICQLVSAVIAVNSTSPHHALADCLTRHAPSPAT